MKRSIFIRHGGLSGTVWLLVLHLTATASIAQQSPPPNVGAPPVAEQAGDEQVPTAKPPAPAITAEELQQRLKAVDDLPDLDDDARAKIRGVYERALQHLAEEEGYRARARSFASITATAEERTGTVRFEVSATPTNVTINIPSNATLQQLTQLAEEANATVSAAQERKNELDAEPSRRSQRRVEIPKLEEEARRKELELTNQLTTIDAESPLGKGPQKARIQAQLRSLAREKELYEKERNAYTATADLLPLERELASLQLSVAEKQLVKWRELVDTRRREEADQKAEAARVEAAMASPALQPLALRNEELAETSQQLVIQIQQIRHQLDATKKLFTKVEDQFSGTKKKVDQIGLTNAIGLLLRQQNASLPDVREYRTKSREHEQEIRATQLKLMDLEEEHGKLLGLDRAETILEELDETDADLSSEQLEQAVNDLLDKQKEHFSTLLQNENAYFGWLVDLENAETQLIKIVAEYDNYINQRILWVRSSSPLNMGDFHRSGGAVAWLLDREHWSGLVKQSWTDIRAHTVFYAIAVLVFGLLLAFQQHLRHLVAKLGEEAAKGSCQSFFLTAQATGWTLAISAVWPLLMLTIAWRLRSVHDATELSKFLSDGLAFTAFFYFAIEVMRQVCRNRGLAQAHFEWPDAVRMSLRRNLRWFMLAVIPLVFLAIVFYTDGTNRWYDSLPRILFITISILTAVFAHIMLHPKGQLFRTQSIAPADSRFYRLRYVWYLLVMMLPIWLVVLATYGFHYTAQRLALRLMQSIWWLQVLLIIWAMTLRWLLIMRRRLAIEMAKERRAALQNQDTDQSSQAAAVTTAPGTDLVESSKQSRKLLQAVLVATAVFGLWFIWVEVIPALEFLDRVVLWKVSVDGDTLGITLSSLLLGILIFIVTLLATKNIPGLLELVVLSRLPLDSGTRYAIITICRYIIAIVGMILAFNTIGVPWSKYQWLIAAGTVGLGFGLQEIFANFVSGLIVLLERPMQVGDVVTIDGITGTVSRIHMRATTVTNWDRQELIVPNKEFVTGRLLNWTLSNAINRVVIKVGVAYGSDIDLASQLLLAAAKDCQHVMDDPEPVATFEQFGDSSLELTLRCYLPNLDNRLATIHQVHSNIQRKFAEAGMEIPFPQRDIHFRTSVEPVILGARQHDEDLSKTVN